MLNISLLAGTKVVLLDLRVCIALNEDKLITVTLTLIRLCPVSNLAELLS